MRTILYLYYWDRITPVHLTPRLTRWRKQCLENWSENWSEKATLTGYQVQVTFSDWLSEHYRNRALGLGQVAPDLRVKPRVNPWIEPCVWCNPDPNQGLYFFKQRLHSSLKEAHIGVTQFSRGP